jgi:murein L,D-transpeptidase YcbB/YkuD
MLNLRYLIFLIVFFVFSLADAQYHKLYKEVKNHIRDYVEKGETIVEGERLVASQRAVDYYTAHNFEPVWFDKDNRLELIGIIEGANDEGLNPEDYHIEKIKQLEKMVDDGAMEPEKIAALELLLSDAVVMYGHHLLWGKVDQSKIRSSWDVPKSPAPVGLDSLFTQYKFKKDLNKLFEDLKPSHYMYTGLKQGLKRYREIAENGGWPHIPSGEVLKPGMTDERVPVIRKYLYVTGDYGDEIIDEDTSLVYDDALVDAVKRFQFRHNLTTDGVIGKGTLKQMNVPVEKRIDMLRVNLERGRWVLHDLPDDFLVVNIAGFNVRRIQNDSITYFSHAIVGKLHHESPIFKGRMLYAVINPTWTVPYSIATSEMLPRLKRDAGYLKKKNLVIMDRNGKILDPSSIDFSKYSAGHFPFIIRQEPGPHNSLGQVKFIFPNKYSVYLHDTPSRGLFSRQDRAFSHGCIRLEKKWELLMNLMDDPEVWNMKKINEILASKKTTRVYLPYPEDIIILYWTTGASKDGKSLFFNKDVYSRDNAVLNALNAPVTL